MLGGSVKCSLAMGVHYPSGAWGQGGCRRRGFADRFLRVWRIVLILCNNPDPVCVYPKGMEYSEHVRSARQCRSWGDSNPHRKEGPVEVQD